MLSIVSFVAMIPFFGFQEIERAIGEKKLHALLFQGPNPNRMTVRESASGHERPFFNGCFAPEADPRALVPNEHYRTLGQLTALSVFVHTDCV